MGYKLNDLRKLSEDELIAEYDELASRTIVGIDYYADELNRRSNEKTNRTMVKCTIWITIMTAVMSLATIINVIVIFSNT